MSIHTYTFLFPFYTSDRMLRSTAITLKLLSTKIISIYQKCENICLPKPLMALDIIFYISLLSSFIIALICIALNT